MKFLTASLIFFCTMAVASENDLKHLPKSFPVPGGMAVFLDFTEANYEITYQYAEKSASVKAEILFNAPESGFPVFDSVQPPTSIVMDGEPVTATERRTPSRETTLRVMDKTVSVGTHRMTIEVPLKELVVFKTQGVKSAFWTSDLAERQFLERYLPANLEYDQVKMSFLLKFIGFKNKQVIYTNGVVTQVDQQTFKVNYPEYYNASSIFFHTVNEGAVDELRFTLKSMNGRDIPAVVYMSKSVMGSNIAELQKWKENIVTIIKELEADYGPFLHPSITVYNAGLGGMEYCGATMTEGRALGHELFHSYFARGVMPANGNAGWLDEALASWRDKGYHTISSLGGSSGLSSHPYYTRITDDGAYTFGREFMALLNGKFQAKGGLKPFLREMVEKHRFAPLFVEDFIQQMGSFYGTSVEKDFKQYTFKGASRIPLRDLKMDETIHRKMSLAELREQL